MSNLSTPTSPASTPGGTVVPVRVWDLPTRCFHWGLLVCVAGAVISAKVGGNAMIWHQRAGLAVGALLVFRLVWGVVGGRWSRFASFVHAPSTILRYVRGHVGEGELVDVGHNPLGALSVLALLTLLAGQVGSGLVADDEIAFTGPLFAFVSEATSHLATSLHKTVGQIGLYVLVGLHVAAILFYRLRRGQDLVTPMVRGDKLLPPTVPASKDGLVQRLLAAGVLALSVAGAAWVARLGG